MNSKRLTGKVVRKNSEKTYVYIHKKSGGGCAGCSASSGCGSDGLLEEVPTVEGVSEGDRVELTGRSASGRNRGLLFYAGHFALFAVGFAVGDSIAPLLSSSPGGIFSMGTGIAAVLAFYGPVHLSDMLRARRGDSLKIIPPRPETPRRLQNER